MNYRGEQKHGDSSGVLFICETHIFFFKMRRSMCKARIFYTKFLFLVLFSFVSINALGDERGEEEYDPHPKSHGEKSPTPKTTIPESAPKTPSSQTTETSLNTAKENKDTEKQKEEERPSTGASAGNTSDPKPEEAQRIVREEKNQLVNTDDALPQVSQGNGLYWFCAVFITLLFIMFIFI
jgi:hypothetical protein